LVAGDGPGRLAIVEFKKGHENSDVRKVIAQILDYGSSLWRRRYDDLEEACSTSTPGFAGSLVGHVAARLSIMDEAFERN